MGIDFVFVYDFLEDGLSDSDVIEKAFAYAKKEDINHILFHRKDWFLDRAILYYSGITIEVDGVMLKLKEGVFDNVFRSENFIVDQNNPNGYPLEIKRTANVKILGKNGAKIEGSNQPVKRLNYDNGEMEEVLGDIWGWRTFCVHVPCCENFEFGGFYITKTKNWAISCERLHNGYFHDIEFLTSCVNGDGLNFRNGCHDIKIKNISGTTTDDLIALNNGSTYEKYPVKSWKTYLYPLVPSNYLIATESAGDGDIYNVEIENIHLKPVRFVQAVALLARNGNKIRNIKIHGVYEEKSLESPLHANLIGAYYQENYGKENEEVCMQDILVDTVVAQTFEYPVLFREHVRGLKVKNVTQNAESGVCVMACENDEIEIKNCRSVSGIIRDSLKNWKRPY